MTKKQRYCYPKVRDNAQIIPNLNNFLKKTYHYAIIPKKDILLYSLKNTDRYAKRKILQY